MTFSLFLGSRDEPESPVQDGRRELSQEVRGVLETLGIENGCMHSEIKLEPRGPVLIEVNCRRARTPPPSTPTPPPSTPARS